MVPTQSEEFQYYALKHCSLKDQEREEIERLTREFLRNKNKIQKIPFGVSGEHDAYTYDSVRGYAYKSKDSSGGKVKKPGKDKKKALWEHDWKGAVFGTVTIISRAKDVGRNGATWNASCSCGNEFPIPSLKLRQKRVKCLRCGDGKK